MKSFPSLAALAMVLLSSIVSAVPVRHDHVQVWHRSRTSLCDAFLEEYFKTSEDKSATATTYTNFWPADGTMILAGSTFEGSEALVAVETYLLPPSGNKSWWHIIRSFEVVSVTPSVKVYSANIVIQRADTGPGGNRSQDTGVASFTILKDDAGRPRLDPHTESLGVYDLVVSSTLSPTNVPCEAA